MAGRLRQAFSQLLTRMNRPNDLKAYVDAIGPEQVSSWKSLLIGLIVVGFLFYQRVAVGPDYAFC
jgi:hypothetical protein